MTYGLLVVPSPEEYSTSGINGISNFLYINNKLVYFDLLSSNLSDLVAIFWQNKETSFFD